MAALLPAELAGRDRQTAGARYRLRLLELAIAALLTAAHCSWSARCLMSGHSCITIFDEQGR